MWYKDVTCSTVYPYNSKTGLCQYVRTPPAFSFSEGSPYSTLEECSNAAINASSFNGTLVELVSAVSDDLPSDTWRECP